MSIGPIQGGMDPSLVVNAPPQSPMPTSGVVAQSPAATTFFSAAALHGMVAAPMVSEAASMSGASAPATYAAAMTTTQMPLSALTLDMQAINQATPMVSQMLGTIA